MKKKEKTNLLWTIGKKRVVINNKFKVRKIPFKKMFISNQLFKMLTHKSSTQKLYSKRNLKIIKGLLLSSKKKRRKKDMIKILIVLKIRKKTKQMNLIHFWEKEVIMFMNALFLQTISEIKQNNKMKRYLKFQNLIYLKLKVQLDKSNYKIDLLKVKMKTTKCKKIDSMKMLLRDSKSKLWLKS